MRAFTTYLRAVCLALGTLPFCSGQDATHPSKPEHTPAVIRTDLLVISSQVISDQWPQTPQLVDAPVNLQALAPGQCVQFGITATGDDRDRLLQGLKFYLEVQFAGKTEMFQGAGPQMVRDLKPEVGDFVTEASGPAGIKNPILSLVSVAVPPARWCAPLNAGDGSAMIKGKVRMTSGKSIFLPSRSISVNTSDTARHAVPFKTPPGIQSFRSRQMEFKGSTRTALGSSLCSRWLEATDSFVSYLRATAPELLPGEWPIRSNWCSKWPRPRAYGH